MNIPKLSAGAIIILLLTGCYATDNLAEKLKSVPLPYDNRTTIEQLFNNYKDCSYVEWISDQKENWQDFVIVRCFIRDQFKRDLNNALAHFKKMNQPRMMETLNHYAENQDKIKEIYQDFSFKMNANHHNAKIDAISTIVIFYPDKEAAFTISRKNNADEIHHIMRVIYEKHSLEEDNNNGITPYIQNVQKAILANKKISQAFGLKIKNHTPSPQSEKQSENN